MNEQQWQKLNKQLIDDDMPMAINPEQAYETQEQETINRIPAVKHKLHDDFDGE